MDNDPTDELLEQEAQTVDLSAVTPVNHQFDRIIGNQLTCSLHDACTSITVSPTAVLEPNAKGELIVVDKRV